MASKTRAAIDLAAFLAKPHGLIVLDLGCGDGRATARLAAADADSLVIGVDANLDAAARVMRRARRAPEKGGLPNLAFVTATADDLPTELEERVDELRVELPWGSLLEGMLVGDPALWGSIRRVLAPGGRLRVVLNARSLPPGVGPEEAIRGLTSALTSIGLEAIHVAHTALDPTTGWGKRLAGGRPLRVVVGEGRRA